MTAGLALGLTLLGVVCWWASTLGAGGGAILFLPVARSLIDPLAVPVVIAVASTISSVQRTWMYRRDVELRILVANVIGLVPGAALGVWALRGISAEWLGLLVGGFLVVFSLSSLLGSRSRAVARAETWHFSAASFATAVLSSLVGASGPTMNPFYLRARILKEAMIGTKAVSTLAMQLAKGSAFAAFGLLTPEIAIMGALVGAGALLGNWIGKYTLQRISGELFERVVHVTLLASGGLIFWRALLSLG